MIQAVSYGINAEVDRSFNATWNGKDVCAISKGHGEGITAGGLVDYTCNFLSTLHKAVVTYAFFTFMIAGGILHSADSYVYHTQGPVILAIAAMLSIPLTLSYLYKTP